MRQIKYHGPYPTIFTGFTGSLCCFHLLFTEVAVSPSSLTLIAAFSPGALPF
ncbi:hypothetical protein DFH07DRAFT_951575 [Mycena maculata]|uniref:Uncharacterized protein n=1 Tax=Mycena maculata TaxID=230809 RepID=A0AAD7K2N5_9AGAR|nr:hypothetical protein DFH07DRAFT_951575 [Mycena maculata]